MSKRAILDNIDWLVTVNESQQVLRSQAIAIESGVIVEIADSGTLRGDEVIDLADHIVTPGLINCHTHLAMTLLRGWA
ncbi:MAG: amidohydrolase family protein, partial [Candidatus Nanopelagicaceae bacterium]